MLTINKVFQANAWRQLGACAPWLVGTLAAASLIGCGGSSSDSDSTGFLKFYNASDNAPYIYLELNEAAFSGADFGKSNGMYEIDSDSYDMTLSFKEGTSDYNTINEQTIDINDAKVTFVVMTGDASDPQVQTYQYEDEDPETEDNQFTFRWLNLHPTQTDVDVYMSQDDQTFNEAVLLGSQSHGALSESHYYELESYKFYLTETGSSEVLYESDEIPFIYTSQYIMTIRANNGPGESPFTIDRLSKTGSGVAYADIDAGAQLRFYNGLAQNPLLPQFNNEIDINLDGVNGNESITGLAKGQFSEALDFNIGDYAIDIKASDNGTAIAENHFVSLPTNSDRTVFVFLTEVTEEDDGDPDTVEETEIYVNTLPVDNSNRVSLYDHKIDVINLVDDYDNLSVYFVRSNETVDTAEYKLFSASGEPDSITLENNSFDISVVGSENDNDLLLAFEQISLSSDSGDLFMIIEEAPESPSGYSIKFQQQ